MLRAYNIMLRYECVVIELVHGIYGVLPCLTIENTVDKKGASSDKLHRHLSWLEPTMFSLLIFRYSSLELAISLTRC